MLKRALLALLPVFTVPLAALAQTNTSFFGPIVPGDTVSIGGISTPCPLGINAVIVTVNNLTHFAVAFAILVAVLVAAYAGILWVTTPFSPNNREQGRTMLLSAVVGLFFVLCAWLIVSAFMAVFYVSGSFFGNWQTLLSGQGSPDVGNCLSVPKSPPPGLVGGTNPVTSGGGSGNPATAGPLCQNDACSPSALQAVGFNQNQANAMSCIAMTESSGQAGVCNQNACGIFQIMLTVNQLNGSACAQFNNGVSSINCPAICKGNNGVAVQTQACQPCVLASKNAQCNDQSAYSMFQKSGGYTSWTSASDNTKSGACIQKYDPSN